MSHSRPGPMLALFALPLLSACSMLSQPKPQGSALADAEDAVRDAERAHVSDYDAVGMRTTLRQLAVARALDADPQRTQLARWIAAQTVVDAELAQARARRSRIFAYYDDLRHTVSPATPAPAAVTTAPTPAPAAAPPTSDGAPAGDATP